MAINNIRTRRSTSSWPEFDNPGPKNPPAKPPPSGGVNYDQPDFYLPFTDMGAGRVQINQARGSGTPTFTRATTATTILSTGLVASVASGIPRSYYTTGGTYLGYLAEGARTNICLRSAEFDNAVWTASTVTVSADSVASPDGTTTADTLTATAANGTVIQDLGVIGSAVKAWGLWLKRKTGTGNIDLTLDGGSTWTTRVITTSWVRYEITQTLANPDIGIRLVTDTDEVYVWGGQCEAAAFLSTDIPTTSAAVTRNGDVLTYPLAGNILGTIGTAFAQITIPSVASGVEADMICSSSGSGQPLYRASTGQLSVYDGTAERKGNALAATSTQVKVAATWSGSTAKTYQNGVASSALTFDGDMSLTTPLIIGSSTASAHLFGTLQNVKIFNYALSDAAVAGL